MHSHRRPIRLRDYDYTQDGVYFITICARNRQCLFAEVVGDEMRLNKYGEIVGEQWEKTEMIRREITLDVFVVMPNHFHAVVVMDGAHSRAPLQDSPVLYRPPKSLGALVAGFKSAVTTRINTLRDTPGVPVWQRNYYDHVIRNQQAYDRIRQYILSNPALWASDSENPLNVHQL
jgi:REP element-mobilizing transposase RayT